MHALVDALTPLILPVFGVVGTVFAVWARSWLVHRGLRTDVFDAVARGAAAAYADLAASGGQLTNRADLAKSLHVGAQYVIDMVPSKLEALGIDQRAVSTIVNAEFGKLLAADPTINVGGGSSATASAGAGEAAVAVAGART